MFPEYYILRVDEFNRHAVTPLDEWIRFLKSGTIDEGTKVEGLKVAKERLRVAGLSREERLAYDRHIEAVRVQWDVLNTAKEKGLDEGRAAGRAEGREEGRAEGLKEGWEEGLKEGREEGRAEGRAEEKLAIARGMKADGLPAETIAKYTGLSEEEIATL